MSADNEAFRDGWVSVVVEGVQQETDGRTIWINDRSGMCIGRLSPMGIDVHHSAEKQMLNGAQCLYCEDRPNIVGFPRGIVREQYVKFCEKMLEHHNVTVSKDLVVEMSDA